MSKTEDIISNNELYESLVEQNKILKEALEFYADQENWSAGVSEKWDTIHNDGKGITFNCGCESLCEGCDGECYAIVSGNLARQALEKCEEIKWLK